MTASRPTSPYYAEWNLGECRSVPQLEPAPHQTTALGRLATWYAKPARSGGILVLPTGGGKTFSAVRFLAEGPLSDGYKVLWLAHTHHLLEQAFHSFRGNTLGSVREPRRELRLRVVSGTEGHFPPRDIRASDDVVIGTLQTITGAVNEGLRSMTEFIAAAKGKLFIVFDEAHHAPAPSYRRLLEHLKATPAPVLGLTATPVYSDETKRGWLNKLFPDGIVAQARANELMAAEVLARPRAVPLRTTFTPSFDEREYETWLGTYKDIPEHIIEQLANNAERNTFIARAYADNRKKFGKTIIFTDRWFQCEFIAEALGKLGVGAGCVYSHADATLPTVAQRRKRGRDENALVLEQFRKNQLDVLINVRMLTEGTDIPDVKTVFLTRQTTSRIQLTQMVGRALRGPKFGGTAEAFIVSFEDDWRHEIQWAGFELTDGGADDGASPHTKRPPVQLISIDLVKKLSRQMEGGVNVTPQPFQTLLPLGWYRTVFDARTADSDDVEPVDLLVMVFEDERESFELFVAHLLEGVPDALASESATFEEHRELVGDWRQRYFGTASRSTSDLDAEMFQIARHVAQRGNAPQFFPFEVRAAHDLDAIAEAHIDRDVGPRTVDEELRLEFAREDRLWRTLFTRFEQLRHFYDGCQARLLAARREGVSAATYRTVKPTSTEAPSLSEPDESVKAEVLERDGGACLACGTSKNLQVDHILAVYHGGSNEASNLQTLCKRCNLLKARRTINFRSYATQLSQALADLMDCRVPSADDAANAAQWERFLRRTINFFFQCGAVGNVAIAGRGDGYYNWTVTLRSGNRAAWLAPHLKPLLSRIQQVRDAGGKPRLDSLRICAPGQKDVVVRA